MYPSSYLDKMLCEWVIKSTVFFLIIIFTELAAKKPKTKCFSMVFLLQVAVTVELEGTYTRGMMAVDHMGLLKKKHKAVIMKKVDLERFKQMLMNALK